MYGLDEDYSIIFPTDEAYRVYISGKVKLMKRFWLSAAGLSLLLCFCCGAVLSRDKHQKGRDKKETAGDRVREVLPESEMVFSREEQVLISRWYSNDRGGLPPGLAKRDRLPPGLEKQLRRKGTLPPGLQKKIQPMPMGLERQLRVLPTGYRRVVIGGNVVLMNEKTALIYDIVRMTIP